MVNPYAADLFWTIFHSIEAGIANPISSSKWREMFVIMQKYTSSKCNYLINQGGYLTSLD